MAIQGMNFLIFGPLLTVLFLKVNFFSIDFIAQRLLQEYELQAPIFLQKV
jgi:hypothetical protein